MNQSPEKFGPPHLSGSDIFLLSVAAFVAGLIGSVFLLVTIFPLSGILQIQEHFHQTFPGNQESSSLFPILLSFISFLATLIVSVVTYLFFHIVDNNRYKKTSIHFGNIAFLSLIVYILFAPIYIWSGMVNYENILIVFILHVLLLGFWNALVLELLNNYRHILVWLYASFSWLILSGLIVFSIFFYFESGFAKLLSLLLLLPLSNFLGTFCKGCFEYLYLKYYKFTGHDQLWDIFYQIEQEVHEENNGNY